MWGGLDSAPREGAPGPRCEGAGEDGPGSDFHCEGRPTRSEGALTRSRGARWGDAPWGAQAARSRGWESSWELGAGGLQTWK